MANTKITSRVLADDAVGLAQLNISNDPSNGQALTYVSSSNDLQWATISGGASSINGLSDAKTFGTSSIMIGDTTTGTIDAANNNTGVGVDIFAALTSGDDNSVFGKGAGAAISTGQRNVYIGIDAGASGATNSENCLVGRLAGKLNTASAITALGTEALYNNTGNNNTGLGAAALNANTSGANNTAVGRSAMPSNTTGYNNTAIGNVAMNTCTTGYDCTAVGKGALYDLTTGDACSAFGHEAGENVTTAIHGTYIGRRAAQNLTTGGYVTVVGANGATSITSGTYNTLIGYGAGNRSNPLTSGSSCTMVGALTGPSGTLGNANAENVFGFNISANGTGTTTLGASGSGLYATHGSTGWSSVSDERYKKDITDATLGLSFINDLRPRTFKWKTCGEVPNDTPKYEEGSTEIIHETMPGVMHGFIAQEVKTVIDNHSNVPDNQLIWKETPDGIQNLAKEELIPALVKAVQELSAKNDALETRIQELEG